VSCWRVRTGGPTIVIGQFTGIAALVAVSAAAAMAAVVLPAPWIALLGVVPLLLGVRKLWQFWRSADGDDDGEGLREREHILERRSHSQVLAVGGVTVANGGDNLGVYVHGRDRSGGRP
jgi:cadmium resistance protein CadD (predicted permease)